jgi:outer membrane lipoprotein carrier protein
VRFLAVALTLAVATAVAGAQAPSAADLAKQLQAHYDTVKSFTADFTQQYKGGVLKQTSQGRGILKVKKPGRMRWTYTSADKQEMVADGSQTYTYIPADRKVYVAPIPKDQDASAAILFLTGRGDFSRDFTAELPPDQPADGWKLRLTPKVPQTDFKTLTLIVDKKTMAMQGMETADDQGGTSTYTFTSLKENVNLPDSVFVFDLKALPKNVEVIRP